MNRVAAIAVLVFAGLAGIFVIQLVRGLLLAAELSAAVETRAAVAHSVVNEGGRP